VARYPASNSPKIHGQGQAAWSRIIQQKRTGHVNKIQVAWTANVGLICCSRPLMFTNRSRGQLTAHMIPPRFSS